MPAAFTDMSTRPLQDNSEATTANLPLSTVKWLDERFARKENGYYFAHQPIYGFASPHSEPGHLRRIARTVNILTLLSRLEFETFLDVGAGEGYLSYLISKYLGKRGVCVEISVEACRRAQELFGLPCVVADAHSLPFQDCSLDVVIASELLEHVLYPELVAEELLRVSRRFVVVTSEEFCETDGKQSLMLKLREPKKPHFERNFFTLEDLRRMFGKEIFVSSEFMNYLPRDETKLVCPSAEKLIERIAKVRGLERNGVGVIYLAAKGEEESLAPQPTIVPSKLISELVQPLVSSPYEAGGEVPGAVWHSSLPGPVCRVKSCAAYSQSARECSHLIKEGQALYLYKDEATIAYARPSWASKFDLSLLAQGQERVRLSRRLRALELFRLLTAPEPLGFRVLWFLKQIARKLFLKLKHE